ncbi:hypothetical protein A8H39_00365 [Paraburkholderia fungorum]|uniref:hypothetical protein n=1 Tax=Paraburkholderia fungorum TaxID=134537 RepID=UPI000486A780|nr:hypothetical protein [Paraburkholderia fungorum]PNE59637.1 hypothetical protein A8H39_00365 [Paraburkholderia fungorum]
MNSVSNTSETRSIGAVKGDVGEVAVVTVDLIKRGVAVYRVGDVFGNLTPSEQDKWFVSVSDGSPLAEKVMDIPLASTEAEAWELAIMFLATHHAISGDLREGLKTHRRTVARMLRDIRDHASYSVYCEIEVSEHYGHPLTAWDRLVCWLGGAATGFFNDHCWMPITWRLTGRTRAQWDAFVNSTSDNVEPSTDFREEQALR